MREHLVWALRLPGLAFAILLAACANTADHEPTRPPVPKDWAPASADHIWPPLNWWAAFSDTTLDELVRTALYRNHDAAAAVERIHQAKAQLGIAGANAYPSLSGTAGIAREQSGSTSSGQRVMQPASSYQVGLTARYQLDLFGANGALRDAAAARLKGTEFDRQTVALSVAAMTVTTYFQISALDARSRVASEALAAARSTLGLVRARQREGRAAALQVAQARAEVARLEAAIPALETQIEQTRNALAVLLGALPGMTNVAVTPLDQFALPSTPTSLPSSLLARRPDVLSAEAALVDAGANARAARAAMLPRIDLTAQGGFASLALRELFNPGNLFYALAVAATAPLFDGGRLEGEARLSEAKYRELVQAYGSAVISAFADMRNALTAQKNSGEVAVDRIEESAQLTEVARLTQLRFREGMTDYAAVLEAQQAFLLARDLQVQSRLDQLKASVSVYQAIGGGWGRPADSKHGAQGTSVDIDSAPPALTRGE